MRIIGFILALVFMGSMYSGALLFFFQKKKALGFTLLGLGVASTVVFYTGIAQGWILLPPPHK